MHLMHHVAYNQIDAWYCFKEGLRRPSFTFSSPGPNSTSRRLKNFSKRPTFSNNHFSEAGGNVTLVNRGGQKCAALRRMHHVAYKQIDPWYWFKEGFRRPFVTFSFFGLTSFSKYHWNFSKRGTFYNNLWSQKNLWIVSAFWSSNCYTAHVLSIHDDKDRP